eukprot:CAMPEP_0179457926 /NCGR_PEP_ID=MMETSP0799-20121207/41575_1 /TAXON_ID=46947 /ORGANISM="Geminigera cryophila, Strain CCMP2564" /LENGTH=41 /DNA_ID= /DNA_START= /DNA_END= /DNA_ORIENTATION=
MGKEGSAEQHEQNVKAETESRELSPRRERAQVHQHGQKAHI